VQVGFPNRANLSRQDAHDGVGCTPDGHRHTQAYIHPHACPSRCTRMSARFHVRACVRACTGTETHTSTRMHAAARAGCSYIFRLPGDAHRPHQHGSSAERARIITDRSALPTQLASGDSHTGPSPCGRAVVLSPIPKEASWSERSPLGSVCT
jgi:hypothetical protein